MATHAGSIESERSKAGRLYRLLLKKPGRRWSSLELALKFSDPCVHTTVHEVRSQLGADWEIVCERKVVGTRRWWVYALVPRAVRGAAA